MRNCWIELEILDRPLIDVEVSESPRIDLEIGSDTGGRLPPYAGPYLVIPKAWQDQVLATKNKSMTDDVTVTEVPYTEVSNIYGTTVSIATE